MTGMPWVGVAVPCGVVVLRGPAVLVGLVGGVPSAVDVACALVTVCSAAPSRTVVVPPRELNRRVKRIATSKTTARPAPIAASNGQGGRPRGGWSPERPGQAGCVGGIGGRLDEVGKSRGSPSMDS